MRTPMTLLIMILWSAALAWGQPPQYKLIDLGPVGARDVSEAGQVVGIDSQSQQAARLLPSGASLLPNLEGGYFSRANGSNLWAQVVGYSSTGEYGLHTHAVVWDHNDNPEDLGTLGGENLFSAATATSSTMTITGYADDATGQSVVPVVWVGRTIIELPTLGGAAGFADDVNDYGIIVGESQASNGEWHATLWDIYGVPEDLQPVFLHGNSRARAINRYGAVVGEITTEGRQYGFHWKEEEGFGLLEPLTGDIGAVAVGINASGLIVGSSQPVSLGFPPAPTRAVLWKHRVAYDLNALIANPHDGWHLATAVGISRGGTIAGTGAYNGQRRSWLLVPCAGKKCQ